jgi:hypothetical protein
MTWELSEENIGTYTIRALHKADVKCVLDIFKAANLTLAEFGSLDVAEVVEHFCENCEGLKRFGQKSKWSLLQFLRENKREILTYHFAEAYKESSQEIEEEDDFIPDLGDMLPIETLLIGVSVTKGGVEYACIEDVILEIETAMLESDDHFTDDTLRECIVESIQMDEWPTDRPIYISAQAAKVYPEIVVELAKRAVLILRS